MKVITKYPVYFNTDKVSPSDYYVSAEGENDSFDYADGIDNYELVMGADGNYYYSNAFGDMYLPFDGQLKSDLEPVLGADGETYYMSADGETFYNAKGEKIKKFFSKVGKGIVQGAKAVGRFFKEAKRVIVEKKKEIIANVNKKREKRKADRLLKHQKNEKGQDVLTEPLQKIDKKEAEKLPDNQVVIVEDKAYKVPEDLPKNAPIVVNNDPKTGEKTVSIDIPKEEAVAVPDAQGNITYYRESKEEGMSKGLKTALIVGGAVVGVALIGFLIYRVTKKK